LFLNRLTCITVVIQIYYIKQTTIKGLRRTAHEDYLQIRQIFEICYFDTSIRRKSHHKRFQKISPNTRNNLLRAMETSKLKQALNEIIQRCKTAGHKLHVFEQEDVILEKVIGRGEEGIVQLCRVNYHGLEELAAVKTITTNGDKEMLAFLLQELEMVVMGSDAIANTVLKVYGVTLIPIALRTRSNHEPMCHLGIVMERGICNLLQLCIEEELDMKIRVNVMLQLARGIHHLHSGDTHIMHRDIKPQNVCVMEKETSERTGLLKSVKLKLIDLGMACAVKSLEEKVTAVVGTEGFHAPEMWDEKPYTVKADVFSLGITFLLLLMEKDSLRNIDDTLEKLHAAKIKGILGKELFEEMRHTMAGCEVPRDLENLLQLMMEDVKQRPQDVGMIHKKLCIILETIQPTIPPTQSAIPLESQSTFPTLPFCKIRSSSGDSGYSSRDSDSNYGSSKGSIASLDERPLSSSPPPCNSFTENGTFQRLLNLKKFTSTPSNNNSFTENNTFQRLLNLKRNLPKFSPPLSASPKFSQSISFCESCTIRASPTELTFASGPSSPRSPTSFVKPFFCKEEFEELAKSLESKDSIISSKEQLLAEKEKKLTDMQRSLEQMATQNRKLKKQLSLSGSKQQTFGSSQKQKQGSPRRSLCRQPRVLFPKSSRLSPITPIIPCPNTTELNTNLRKRRHPETENAETEKPENSKTEKPEKTTGQIMAKHRPTQKNPLKKRRKNGRSENPNLRSSAPRFVRPTRRSVDLAASRPRRLRRADDVVKKTVTSQRGKSRRKATASRADSVNVEADTPCMAEEEQEEQEHVRVTRNQKQFWQNNVSVTRSKLQDDSKLKGLWDGFNKLKRLTSVTNWF